MIEIEIFYWTGWFAIMSLMVVVIVFIWAYIIERLLALKFVYGVASWLLKCIRLHPKEWEKYKKMGRDYE